jgi:hypothetical protein
MSTEPISFFSFLFSLIAVVFSVLAWLRDTNPDISLGFGEEYETSDEYDVPPEKFYYIDIVNNSPRKVQIRKIVIEWRKSWLPVFTKTKTSIYKSGNNENMRKFWIEPWESKEFGNHEEAFLEQIDVNTKNNKSIWVNMAVHVSANNAVYRTKKLNIKF